MVLQISPQLTATKLPTSHYKLNEVIAIYPITPSSGMGELSDLWSSLRKPIYGEQFPIVQGNAKRRYGSRAVLWRFPDRFVDYNFTAS